MSKFECTNQMGIGLYLHDLNVKMCNMVVWEIISFDTFKNRIPLWWNSIEREQKLKEKML